MLGKQITDSAAAIGDIIFIPVIDWHDGNLPYSAGLSIFAPTGNYDTATVGLNTWSLQPVFAMTYFDPDAGMVYSAATGLLFTEKNSATDY